MAQMWLYFRHLIGQFLINSPNNEETVIDESETEVEK